MTQILFLRKFGVGLTKRFDTPAALLEVVSKISMLFPTHTRRSENSQSLQQFSTPVGLGLVAAIGAGITSEDVVLEPSAGSGLLAVHAERAGAPLVLNEYANMRADVLAQLFTSAPVTRFDAAHIHDYLDPAIRPSVVLMNPPFSSVAHVDGSVKDAAMRHISSALSWLCDGGRLVVITGAGCSPDVPAWRDAFIALQERGRVVFTAAIDGKVYAKHGTTAATRLTVIDRIPADDPNAFPTSPGIAPDTATLLTWVLEHVPPRAAVSGQTMGMTPPTAMRSSPVKAARAGNAHSAAPMRATTQIDAVELSYEIKDWTPEQGAQLTDAIYEPYTLQSLTIDGATPHPTALVQSAAMSSVAPPKPSYRPHLPSSIVRDAMLSDAQLESVIYAGEAHSGFLSGAWTVDATYDKIEAAQDDAEHAVQFRRGWFLGDGTGAGKGRQVAGIILDNQLKGRKRALWISVSDRLLEDAQRDWAALGQERLLVTPCRGSGRAPRSSSPKACCSPPMRHCALKIAATRFPAFSRSSIGWARIRRSYGFRRSPRHGQCRWWQRWARRTGALAARSCGSAPPTCIAQCPDRLRVGDGRDHRSNPRLCPAARTVGGEDFPFATRGEFVAAIEEGGVAAREGSPAI